MGVAGSGRADGDGLDLEACAARQGGGLDAGARGERRDERAGIDLVHGGEIGEIGQKDRGLGDVLKPEAGGGEDGADVGEGALGLRRRVVRDFARGGVRGNLSGDENEWSGRDALRVGTERGGGGRGGKGDMAVVQSAVKRPLLK